MSRIVRGWLFAAAVASCVSTAAAQTSEIEAPATALVRSTWPADGPGGAVIVTRQGVGARVSFEGDGPQASAIRSRIGVQEFVGERLPD